MQNFETLFRRAWERSREVKLSVYILLNWLILASLAAGIAFAGTAAYRSLVEKRRAEQSVVEVNPELRRIFAPKRKLKFKDARLSFGYRDGDTLGKVVIRTPDREIRARSAVLRLDVDKSTVNLALRGYRIYEVAGGEAVAKPASEDEWGTLDMVYPFEMPPGVKAPKEPVPGEIARGLVAVAGIVLGGAVLWCWIWQMFSAGIARETLHGRPTRMLRGLWSGLRRWRTVMYPLPLLTVCSIVSLLGSLPNILQLPLPFYLAIYPLACALEITLLVFCGILKVGVALNPPESRFGDLFRESARVFLNGWGRYVLGILWVYAFAALSAVLLAPGLVLLIDAVIFGSRAMLVSGIVWSSVWAVCFVVSGLRVLGCIAAYQMYLYVDALNNGQAPEAAAAVPAEENGGGDGK